jgi:hypothetical protein
MINLKINSIFKYLFLINIFFVSNRIEAEKFNLATPDRTIPDRNNSGCVSENYYGGPFFTRCIRYRGKPVNTLNSSLFLSCKINSKTYDNEDEITYKSFAISERESVISVYSMGWTGRMRNDYKANINKWKGTITWKGVKAQNDTKFVIRTLKDRLGDKSYMYEEKRDKNKKMIIEDAEIGDSKFSGEYWTNVFTKLRSSPGKGTCRELSKRQHVKNNNYFPILIK